MPLAYRVVNGSLSDVNTLKDTVREFIQYGATPYGMVMDRGFWGQERLQMLTDEGIKYMLLLGVWGIKYFEKLIQLPSTIMIPIILVFTVVGSFAINENVFDVFLMLVLGIIGYFMQA